MSDIRVSELTEANVAELTDSTVLIVNTPSGETKRTTWGKLKSSGGFLSGIPKSADGTVINNQVALCDASGGSFTITLPINAANLYVVLKKIDASANTVTIQPNAVGFIDGNASINLLSQYDSVTLFCDGTNWFII